MPKATGVGPRAVVIEADGGSRGNPGQAAYGAVLMDAETRAVIAERAERIGVATNNVAEYRGLLAGLELFREHAPEADLEVRLDSKLVVEQMSGNWKIKHPDLKPLAMAAHRLVPFGTTFTWIPRAQNTHADRILNEALDAPATRSTPRATGEDPRGPATTMVLVRHGETEDTTGRKFSGRGGKDPGLTTDGAAQVRATADWLAPLADEIDVMVSSPMRRAKESAEIIAERLDLDFEIEVDLAEAAFGSWDGLTFDEVHQRFPGDLDAWLGSTDVAPGGGDSMTAVDERVRGARDRLLSAHQGRTVLAVSHLSPITVLVRQALDAPLESVYRMELAPASVTVISWFEAGRASMRMFNARPMESAFIGR